MKFLVPVDFSPSAENASRFAAKLAKALDGGIHFIHALMPATGDRAYSPSKTMDISMNPVMQIYLYQEAIRKKFDVISSSDILIGGVTDGILKAAKTSNASMIVMGTSGDSGLKKILSGSYTASIMEQAEIPVLAVPEKAGHSLPKRIVYLTDYKGSDIDDLKELALFADQISAEIITLHIATQSEKPEAGRSVNQYFSDLLKKNIAYPRISSQVIQPVNTLAGLKMFLQEEGIDMLAIAPGKRNVLKKLFNKSLTKEFISDIEIPVLVG